MKIEPETTIPQLEIGLAKLGVHSMAWSANGEQHIVTLLVGDNRYVGYGLLMTGALNDALNRAIQAIGTEVAIAQRPTSNLLNESRMLRANGLCGIYKTPTVNDQPHGFCTLPIGHTGDHKAG